MGRLDEDQVVRTEASFGYSVEMNPRNIEKPLEAKTPMPAAVREKRIIIADVETLMKDFPEYQPHDNVSPWKSSVFLPTTTEFVYVFHLQNEITRTSLTESYFHCLSQILSLYQYRSSDEIDTRSKAHKLETPSPPDSMYGKSLTERQSQILNLIKRRMTNSAIASQIGYSDSLVRRETIIIYAKLGIRGRRDLFNPETTGSLLDIRSSLDKDLKQAIG